MCVLTKRREQTYGYERRYFLSVFQELIESYRHDILQREDVKELAQKEIGLWNQIRERFGGLGSEEYKLISELTGCILDISCIKQEQLYLQGVKDGIRLKKRIKEIEEGESC